MKQTTVQKQKTLVENSAILNNWKEGKPIIYNTCFNHKEIRSDFFELKDKVYAPENFDQTLWIGAKLLTKTLKKEGVKCSVLRGNGTTSPAGSDKATNYFIINKQDAWDKGTTNKLYLSFDMTVENAKKIVAVLEKYFIAFTWSGDLGSCFVFTFDREGFPE